MKLILLMELGNAAFDVDEHESIRRGEEVARILRCAADHIGMTEVCAGDVVMLRDVDGNRVGEARVWGG